MGELARATLQPLTIEGGQLGEQIEVCFNPKEYSLEKSVQWTPKANKADAQTVEFGNGTPMTLTIELQFDTYEERVSVRDKFVRKLEALTLVTQTDDTPGATPPMVLFCWGNFKFKGVVQQLSQKYTMFLQDGTPVRASCTIKIMNALDKNETDNGAKENREILMSKGMTPDAAATAAYGDPTQWPKLMADNDVDDPLNHSGPLAAKK